MHPTLQRLCESLDRASEAARKLSTEQRRVSDVWAWHLPTLTPQQIAEIPKHLSDAIKAEDIDDIGNKNEEITNLVASIEALHSQIIPNLFNGNAVNSLWPFMLTINYASDVVSPLLGWRVIKDPKSFPAAIAKRLEKAQARVDNLTGDLSELETKIETINAAHEAAEDLPETLKGLKRANTTIAAISDEASQNVGRIKDNEAKTKSLLENMNNRSNEADKLINNCEEAYRITTSKGLAGAFSERASALNNSMRAWVVGLLVALIAGAYIGYLRVQIVMDSLNTSNIVWTTVWAKIALAAFSIAAPVWFAWLATKHIGQRFRLAEDYAFKASVAKAYEGFRKEAARIDPNFEARLFASALTRLEEAPLRLVETETHSSPMHELASSESIQSTIRSGMELVEKVLPSAKGQSKGNGAPPQAAEVADKG